ncbi:MAG: hypothetical protein ACHQVS_03025 [Candidatus Babeliales bacterium]
MNRIVSRVVLAALITTTVAPTAQAGVSDLFKHPFTPIFSSVLLAFGIFGGLSIPSIHTANIQKRNDERTTKNALDIIEARLEQNKDNQNPIDVDAQLKELKESFPVYRSEYRPSFSTRGIDGRISYGEHWVSIFNHYAISQRDIEDIRQACNYFNRNIDRVCQYYKIKTIHDRLKKADIPTDEQLESGKKVGYGITATCAALGTLGLLGSLYFKYAKNK